MSKVKGGIDLVATGGALFIEGDDWLWCNTDTGSIEQQQYVAYQN